jgi:purine-cytosine permease-like protein
VVIPTTFSVTIGTAIGVPVFLMNYAPYADAYNSHSLGGLIYEIYHPVGWSKFCLIMLTFSVLGNNIAINYSSGLSLQLLGYYFHAVPRFIWSLLVAIIIAVLAIVGQTELEAIINDFVSLLGYWTVSFTIILLIEDKFFRRRDGYVLTSWNQPKNLPLGIAAVLSLLCGYLGGGVPGMAQTWFTGVSQLSQS